MPLGAARFGLSGADLGILQLIETQTYSSGVNNIDFLNIKENKYDVHFLTIENLQTPVESGHHYLRFYENGVLESGSVYQIAMQFGQVNGVFGEIKSTSDAGIQLINTSNSVNQNAYCYLYNLGNSSKYSFVTHHQFFFKPSDTSNFMFGGGVLPQASTVDGIRYAYTGSSTISDFTISLYGIKES